ncbi:uncharacterized protein LOC121244155 [Juglans microcarpa x Juglans regia]|uniref:uncharacterized protein LOC121244155 n=1 Tax=Juglans microcarpa x Juglans regia TaxID=2249226 RepID=UPI001B7E8EF0|nr:uncharacterized protein LOC121244155 [Juglans microcarpa x Juglans regia]
MIKWPVPKSIKALRGVLGFTGYYKKFILDYGIIATLLKALLKNEAFKWSKGRLAFSSQALKGKNLQLSTYGKEFLALVLAIKKWRPYLLGGSFIIRNDHHSLKYLMEQKGVENKVADSSSRKDQDENVHYVLAISVPNATWLGEIKRAYVEDQAVQQQFVILQQNPTTNSSLSIEGGVFFKKGRSYIPNCADLKVRILHFIHASPVAGHSGFHKSLQRARSGFYWPGMKTEIKKFIKECEWSEWLAFAEWWYNTTFHTSTKLTPYEAVNGVPPTPLREYVPGGDSKSNPSEKRGNDGGQHGPNLKDHL